MYQNRNIPFLSILLSLLFVACANMGQGPTGGAKDTTPPKVVSSTPTNQSVNVYKNKIVITFDENVSVKDIVKNVIISPPQKIPPTIKAMGKNITVELNDTLRPNTTYSISFGDAIVDLNESNIFSGYNFAFATGEKIDSLRIGGTLINAENLNPKAGILVGIYANTDTAAFLSKPFLRVARTDSKGKFLIPNIHAGRYRLYALADMNNDYHYQPGEGLAFLDSIFRPVVVEEVAKVTVLNQDTTVIDSLRMDSVVVDKKILRYLPDSVMLRFFKEKKKRQYFVKAIRQKPTFFTLRFNTEATSLPTLTGIGMDWTPDKYILQTNATLDTLSYWLVDSTLINSDTLTFKMEYFKTDSSFQLVKSLDTISVALRGRRSGKKTAKDSILHLKTNLSNRFEIYNPILLQFDEPVATIDTSKIVLKIEKDTLFVPLSPVSLVAMDSSRMKYAIRQKWRPDTQYQLVIDSAAFRGIYNVCNDSLVNRLHTKSLDDYATIKIKLTTGDTDAVFQVLNTKDEVVRTVPQDTTKATTVIRHLAPGDYYIRLFLDRNGNGKWDTGDLSKGIQPEEVFYYPKKLTLIKNWEFEETINYRTTPLLEQKPKELLPESRGNTHR